MAPPRVEADFAKNAQTCVGGIQMMIRFLAAGAVATALMSSAAMAQTLENVQGRVMVDRGSGFSDTGPGALKAGDIVKVVAGGASVNYGGGVVIPVRAGQSYKVSKVYGQGAGANPNDQGDPRYLALGLAGAAAIGCAVVCGDGNDGQVFISP